MGKCSGFFLERKAWVCVANRVPAVRSNLSLVACTAISQSQDFLSHRGWKGNFPLLRNRTFQKSENLIFKLRTFADYFKWRC